MMQNNIDKINDLLFFRDNIKQIANTITVQEFGFCITELCEFLWTTGQEVSVKVSKDNIWYVFERKIWEFGENLRIVLKANKKLGKDKKIQDSILTVAKEKKYKKGRQTFVLLIGILKIEDGASFLVESLDDEDIRVHVIDSILKLKVRGLNRKMEEIYQNTKGGTRLEAKKYLDKGSGNVSVPMFEIGKGGS